MHYFTFKNKILKNDVYNENVFIYFKIKLIPNVAYI